MDVLRSGWGSLVLLYADGVVGGGVRLPSARRLRADHAAICPGHGLRRFSDFGGPAHRGGGAVVAVDDSAPIRSGVGVGLRGADVRDDRANAVLVADLPVR